MKKNILVLSLIFSILGFIRSFFFVFYDFDDVTEFINLSLFSSQAYYYTGLEIYIPRYLIHGNSMGSSTSLDLLNFFFFLTFLSGTFIYYFSKYKETKLLEFNYSLIFLNSILRIISFLLYINIEKLSFFNILFLVIFVLYTFISYYIITKHLNPINENVINDNNPIIENHLENASNYKRFLNFVIDSFIVACIAFAYITYAEQNIQAATFFSHFKSTFGYNFGVLIFFSVIKFIYYFIFESIFKTTPAKFLTACYVTDEEGNSPAFSMILKRTILRFIPFESLSFLMGKNLHDDYSNTCVIIKKRDFKIEKRYLQVLSLSFLTILVIYFYHIFTRNHF